MAGIFLNGTEYFPSDAPKELSKIGTTLVMASGKRRFVQRLSGATPIFKSSWEIPWNDVDETTRAAIEAVSRLTTTFVYVDQHGTSYTVQCEDGAYSDSVSTIAPGALYYTVKLKIYEA
jgi:hypothetical protein